MQDILKYLQFFNAWYLSALSGGILVDPIWCIPFLWRQLDSLKRTGYIPVAALRMTVREH
jgi:hypothetical protein